MRSLAPSDEEHKDEEIEALEDAIECAIDPNDDDGEAWEEELDDNISNPKVAVRSWEDLRTKIRGDLKKNSKNLPLSQLNQLMILSNFATLRIKGPLAFKQVLRLHVYGMRTLEIGLLAVFETWHDIIRTSNNSQKNGEAERACAALGFMILLCDLTNVPTGKVTPRALSKHVNDTIFPELGINPKKPLSNRAGARWLQKLGWRHTLVKKGVYMDGHERPDVVQYRNDVFLPQMAKYEARMVHYEGPELRQVEPKLADGEEEIIPLFHDESCFHANDQTNRAWLQPGEQPLRKKGRGRLIHVSDFINPETGRLVVIDKHGKITHDARKIIFPGSNGDAWWDTKQLLEQLKTAITIFEKAHPGKRALFIFDQSSAHASLPPDALKAFDMNKSDGGKQRHQRDTIIPMSNPDPRFRGKPQKMTLPNGSPKGLKSVLEERGFNITKLRAKCSPVCPFENQDCCMARLLSQQDDFKNQPSMYWGGANTDIVRRTRRLLKKRSKQRSAVLMVVLRRLCCVITTEQHAVRYFSKTSIGGDALLGYAIGDVTIEIMEGSSTEAEADQDASSLNLRAPLPNEGPCKELAHAEQLDAGMDGHLDNFDTTTE
ncbi:DDE family endonuclease [Salix suchowensis]|nr:DDE family endonuclease [Salix suchowensis]